MSLQSLAEVGALLLRGGRLGLGLLLLRRLLLALGQLGLQRLDLVAQIGGRHTVFGGGPHVARDVLQLVAEELLDGGLGAAVILGLVLFAPDDDRSIRLGGGVVDALLLGAIALEFLLPLLEFLDLVGEARLGLVEMFVALQLIELGQARTLLLLGLILRSGGLCWFVGIGLVAFTVFCRGSRGLACRSERALIMSLAPLFAVGVFGLNRAPGLRRARRRRGVRGWGVRRIRRGWGRGEFLVRHSSLLGWAQRQRRRGRFARDRRSR